MVWLRIHDTGYPFLIVLMVGEVTETNPIEFSEFSEKLFSLNVVLEN